MIIIKGELTDLNTYINLTRTNRFASAKVKRDNTTLVSLQLQQQKETLYKELYIVMIDWYVKDSRKDADNIVFAKKFLLDALVEKNYIKDDGQKYIKGFIDMVFVDKLNPRIQVNFIKI